MSIAIFGDSIVNRACDEIGGGWTSRLHNLMSREFKTVYPSGVVHATHAVWELGIGGDTISGIQKRYENELLARIEIGANGDPTAVLVGLAVGINDSRLNEATKIEETPIDVFNERYSKVLYGLETLGVDVFLVGLTPVDEAKVQPVEYSQKLDSYFNERIAIFDTAIAELAASHNLSFVDIYDKYQRSIVADGYDEWLFDGLHPNSQGHQLIAECVYDTIKPKL